MLQPTAEGPYVTPLVRKLASEHGIDLATVTGTGVGGRIRKQDVLDAARSGRGTAPAPALPPPPAAAGGPRGAGRRPGARRGAVAGHADGSGHRSSGHRSSGHHRPGHHGPGCC